MAKYSYTVKSGETPADVAFRYTGKGESYRDMIDLNPHIGKATASCGALVFDPQDWHDGLKVYIPSRWAEGGQQFALPQTRFLGTPLQQELLNGSYNFPQSQRLTQTRPGVQQRPGLPIASASGLSARDVEVGRKFFRSNLQSDWDEKHPKWNGSNLAYWSQRIGAALEFDGVNIGNLTSWLRSFPGVSDFKNHVATYGKYIIKFCPKDGQYQSVEVAIGDQSLMTSLLQCKPNVPGMWYAYDPADAMIASMAAYLRKHNIVPPGGYGISGPRATGLLSDPNTDGDDQPGTGTGTKIAGTGQCSKSPVGDTKPYELRIVAGDYLDKIAQQWLGTLKQSDLGLYSVTALMRVNYDRMDYACTGQKNSTSQVRIPKDWPECPESLKSRRVKSDGTAFVDVEPVAPPVPGTDPIDRVPPGVETVGAGDDDSSTLWMLLAAGAAVAGGIYLYNAKKKGRNA